MTDALLLSLASAPSGSRELSDLLLLACGWERGPGAAVWAKGVWYDPLGNAYKDSPSPTESIDDALKLVPNDANVKVERWYGSGDKELHGFAAIENDKAAIFESGMTDGPNAPALALCIAILKATVAEKE